VKNSLKNGIQLYESQFARKHDCCGQSPTGHALLDRFTLVSISTNESIMAFDFGIRFDHLRNRGLSWKFDGYVHLHKDEGIKNTIKSFGCQLGAF
jgi:hypothetical protein